MGRTKVRELVTRPELSSSHTRLRDAAIDYVAHGWGVVPGSACDGVTYTRGHSREKLAALAPVLPSPRTLRDAHEVWSRWHLAPYGILARAGEVFDVLEVPTWLAVSATKYMQTQRQLCPVSLAPTGAHLLIEASTTLPPQLAAVRGVRVAKPGAYMPLRPTRVIYGQLTWWITPDQTQWRPGNSQTVLYALSTALAEHHPPGAAGEARA